MQTPSAPGADCRMGFVCVPVHCGLFLCEQLRNNGSSTNNAQRSRTIVPLTAFVCGGGETGNEIMLSGCVCARGAYQRAGPGQEENTNHLLAGRAGLMEMRNSSFGAMYQSKVESVVTPGTAISPSLLISSLLISLDSNPALMYDCETVHTKVVAFHPSQQTPPTPFLIPQIPSASFHFELRYLEVLREGAELNAALSCQKHLPSPSTPPPFCIHS